MGRHVLRQKIRQKDGKEHLRVTLERRLAALAPGLTPRSVLCKFAPYR